MNYFDLVSPRYPADNRDNNNEPAHRAIHRAMSTDILEKYSMILKKVRNLQAKNYFV